MFQNNFWLICRTLVYLLFYLFTHDKLHPIFFLWIDFHTLLTSRMSFLNKLFVTLYAFDYYELSRATKHMKYVWKKTLYLLYVFLIRSNISCWCCISTFINELIRFHVFDYIFITYWSLIYIKFYFSSYLFFCLSIKACKLIKEGSI